MSTHPNAILAVRLTPDNLTRATYRAILEEAGIKEDGDLRIGTERYRIVVMEDSYDEGYQITAKEGDILVHDFLTYGYGENCTWDEVKRRHDELEQWAQGICHRHACQYEIFITANYW